MISFIYKVLLFTFLVNINVNAYTLTSRNCSSFEIYNDILQLCEEINCVYLCDFDLTVGLISPISIQYCKAYCFKTYVEKVYKTCGTGKIYDIVGVCEDCQKCEFMDYTAFTENECVHICNYTFAITQPLNSTIKPTGTRISERQFKSIVIIFLIFGSVFLFCICCIIVTIRVYGLNNDKILVYKSLNNDYSSNDVKNSLLLTSTTECSSTISIQCQNESHFNLRHKSTIANNVNINDNKSSDSCVENHDFIAHVHTKDYESSVLGKQGHSEGSRKFSEQDTINKTNQLTHTPNSDIAAHVEDTTSYHVESTTLATPNDEFSYRDTDTTATKSFSSRSSSQQILEETKTYHYTVSQHDNQTSMTRNLEPQFSIQRQQVNQIRLSWSSDNPGAGIRNLPNISRTGKTLTYTSDEHNGQLKINGQPGSVSDNKSLNGGSQCRPCNLSNASDFGNTVVNAASTDHVHPEGPNSGTGDLSFDHLQEPENNEVFPVQEEGFDDIQDEPYGVVVPLQADLISVGSSVGLSSGLGSLRLPLQDPGLTRAEATVNEINELPQHLSLIPNIEDVFRRITRNSWARNVVSNGRYIRVRFDAMNEDVVRQRIREQTGLNDRHFECIYDPSDSPFTSSTFNGHI